MTSPLVVRKGAARTVMLGPDEWSFPAAGTDTSDRFDIIHGSISYLQGPPLHVHYDQDDTFVILEGTLKIQVGDEITDLHVGDVASAPKGTPHTFTNVNHDIVRVINVMTPGGFDRCLEDFAALMGDYSDAAGVEEIAKRHRMALVGPPLGVTLGLATS